MNIKLFEEFTDSINKWTSRIVSDEKFYEWLDKNEDMLRDEYETEDDSISFKEWAKEYYDSL